MPSQNEEFIALIPAAGRASRLPGIPCSKELIPLQRGDVDDYVAPPGGRVAIEACLAGLAENGIRKAVVVVTDDKQDVPAYLDRHPVGVEITCIVRDASPSVPHTLSSAIDDIAGRNVLLVFPDIVVTPADTAGLLLDAHRASAADLTLALVPSERGDKVDLVSVDTDLSVLGVRPKPGHGQTGLTWVYAAWGRRFTDFLADYVAGSTSSTGPEIQIGSVIDAGRQAGLGVAACVQETGTALDIGTPEDLRRLWARSGSTESGP